MQDEQSMAIVDSQGNALKSTKDNKLRQFLLNNIWNILGTGLAACITLGGIINFLFSRNFTNSCASFYGVDRKYFSGTEMFQDKLIFIFCAMALFVYPFIFAYINQKIKNKLNVVLTFFMTILILFMQNILYTINIIDMISWDWLKRLIDNYVLIIVFLVVDILIAYFIIIRNFFWKKKKYNKVEKIIFSITLLLYILNISTGFTIKINYEISDKRAYEVIEQNRAIISNYDGKFVVMNCKIQDETIILIKGSYSLEEMTGVSITYHEYSKVICE